MSEEKLEKQKNCTHHFVLGVATSKYSNGICKYCGAKKQFTNYPDAIFIQQRKKFQSLEDEQIPPGYIKTAEAAGILCVARNTLHQLYRTGKIRSMKVGRNKLALKEDVDAYRKLRIEWGKIKE